MTVKPPKHGRDHEYDSEDRIPGALAWAIGSTQGISQGVTTTDYMILRSFTTNAPDCFGYDPDLPDRIYMLEEGIYQSMLNVHVGSVNVMTPRFIYQQFGYEEVGGFGSELLPAIGTGQQNISQSEADGTTAKSALSHFAHAWAFGTPSDPPQPGLGRYILQGVLGHVAGNDWTVQNISSSLCVVRLSSFSNWKVSQSAS